MSDPANLLARRAAMFDEDDTKIAFRLTPDEDGYPPADWEHLWADQTADGFYTLDNTPFFARGVSFGDVVEARDEDGMMVFQRVVRESGHSTLRVFIHEPDETEGVRAALREWGCDSELSHIPGLVAVDVPPEESLTDVLAFLQKGADQGRWEVEQSAVRA